MLNFKKDLSVRKQIEHCKRVLRVIKNSKPKKTSRQKLIEERTRIYDEREKLKRIIRRLERIDNPAIQRDLISYFEESMRNVHICILEYKVEKLTEKYNELSTIINGTPDWNDKFCG